MHVELDHRKKLSEILVLRAAVFYLGAGKVKALRASQTAFKVPRGALTTNEATASCLNSGAVFSRCVWGCL